MVEATTRFQGELAPCGRSMGGDHFRDRDEDGLVIDHLHYACGCRSDRHEYHDGSIYRRVIRHDGKILVDERSTDHGG